MSFKSVTVAIGLCLFAVGASAQQTILKVSHFLPPASNFQKGVLEPWCKQLAQESGDRLKCQIYPAMQLGGTPAQLINHARDGVADIVWTSPAYTPGRFPVTEALEMPFAVPPDGLRGSRMMWDFYLKHGQQDFKDLHMLGLFSGMNTLIVTTSKPVYKLEDLKGLRLRSPSRLGAKMLQALGAAPVGLPAAQLTDAVTKGVIDGVLASWELIPSVKLEEISRYFTEAQPSQPGFAQVSTVMLMNPAKYAALPADLKAVLDRHSGQALVDRAGKASDETAAKGRQKAEAAGGKILTIDAAEYQRMRATAADLEQEWVKEITAKGHDGAQLLKDLHELTAKYLN